MIDQLGINIASLIAGVGIAGLAFSFAAQDTIANFISGVAIIIDQPFKEGDFQERNLPTPVPRATVFSEIKGKADVVIGMRRSGKTWF